MRDMQAKPVKITWVDSRLITSGWKDLEDVKSLPPFECVSVGLLIDDTDEYKTLAVALTDHDGVFGCITIPTCAIRKMRTLR